MTCLGGLVILMIMHGQKEYLTSSSATACRYVLIITRRKDIFKRILVNKIFLFLGLPNAVQQGGYTTLG